MVATLPPSSPKAGRGNITSRKPTMKQLLDVGTARTRAAVFDVIVLSLHTSPNKESLFVAVLIGCFRKAARGLDRAAASERVLHFGSNLRKSVIWWGMNAFKISLETVPRRDYDCL
jgi:hypothetical protein